MDVICELTPDLLNSLYIQCKNRNDDAIGFRILGGTSL